MNLGRAEDDSHNATISSYCDIDKGSLLVGCVFVFLFCYKLGRAIYEHCFRCSQLLLHRDS